MSAFISYSTKDNDFVDRLSIELIKNRIHIWRDKWEMRPGDSLIDKIQEALIDSSFLLIVLSENSVQSEWCRKELNAGFMRELSKKDVTLIPILIDDCEIPLFLQEKVFADFRTSFEDGFKNLLRPLSRLFSDHIGRERKDEIVSDYSIDWGLRDNLFYTDIDIINWYEKDKKSILLQLKILGCENATNRYLNQVTLGMNWLMKETLISILATDEKLRKLNILTKADEIYLEEIVRKDLNADITFKITIRAVLMGIDNGNDVVINLVDFLEMLDKNRVD